MAANIAAWESYINERIAQYVKAQVPTVLVDWGVVSPASAGWVVVRFGRTFPAVPGIVGIQGEGAAAPRGQQLTPPRLQAPSISAPAIPAPSLVSLKVSTPSPPVSWGNQWKDAADAVAGSTIGQIPLIGGYLSSGFDTYIGPMVKAVGDFAQKVYYLYDWEAGAAAIASAVEAKAAADWNANIDKLQGSLEEFASRINSGFATAVGDVNSAFVSATAVAQDAINAVWPLISEAMGLLGEAIPIVKQRNATSISVELLAPGNGVPVFWLAVYGA